MKEVNNVHCFKFFHMASAHFADQKCVLQPVCWIYATHFIKYEVVVIDSFPNDEQLLKNWSW